MLRILSTLAIAAFAVAFATAASAQATYTFQGGLYNTISNSGACTVGECTTFTGAHRATASITFAGPLAANLTAADVSAQVTSFTFSDGVTTTAGPNALSSTYRVNVTTNAVGVLTSYSILLQRTPGPPYNANTQSDPNSRFSYVVLNPAGSQGVANTVCYVRGAGGSALDAATFGPGNCNDFLVDPESSVGTANSPTVVTAPPLPATVPTLSEWAMILFALLLAGGAALMIHRRQIIA